MFEVINMKLINKTEILIKKSKFISYLYEVETKEEADLVLDELKKEHKKARHIPYAYKIGPLAKKTDDKEPSNTAGMPIYNILDYKKLDNRLIAIVRYFGGTKLGAGLLTRTYSQAAK
jgi:putative IMPACT (imprinted ancient) family translation regulator